jgi:hypothetical protein
LVSCIEWQAGKLKACAEALYSSQAQASKPFNAFDISGIVKLEDVEVWPENVQAFTLFAKVGTQWRVGATGLDYCAVYPLLDKEAKDDDEWWQLFDDIQTLESAALDSMSNKNK